MPSKTNELKDGNGAGEKMKVDGDSGSYQSSNGGSNSNSSSTSSSLHSQKCPVKPDPMTGQKRPILSWVHTRTCQEPSGADPHDNFLDTPMEVIRGNLNKAPNQEVQDLSVPAPKDMDFNNSDEETQEINVDLASQGLQISVLKPGNKEFEYVGPVRKKADRESLKGVECKQCKKFYDVVLPSGVSNNDGNRNDVHCEHHNGVSCHPYRLVGVDHSIGGLKELATAYVRRF